ncbi:MAG: outer membrane beta-barrel protein [Lachnospira sp.]
MSIIAVSSPILLYAQYCSVEGTVCDAQDGHPMQGVTLQYNLDSRKCLETTDKLGKYTFKIPKSKNITLRFSHVGYKPVTKIVNGNASRRVLNIQMQEDTKHLTEVLVKKNSVILTQRGDTTVYKANAIKTNPDATALDMLRKLPGVSYKDGKLEAQGRNVGEIRVDGKEFYKNDIGMALKNLPKEVIEEIKVFEELSDYAKLAGFDDGSGTVIVDVTTKKKNDKNVFGKTSDAIGTDSRFAMYGILNVFNKQNRLSIFSQWNNINEQNFSTIDLLSATGTIASNDPTLSPFSKNSISNSFSHAENNDVSTMMKEISDYGITRTTAAGVNYSEDTRNKKISYNGHYLYNLANNHTTYNIFDEYFGETTSNNRQYQELDNKNINHRFNFKFEYRISDKDYLLVRPSMVMQNRKQISDLTDWTVFPAKDSLLLTQNTLTDQSVFNTSDEIMYMHKFSDNGHALSFNAKFSYTYTDEDMYIQLQNIQSQKDVKQNTNSSNNQKSYTFTASYILPVSKYSKVKADAGVDYVYGHIKQATVTMVNEESEFTIDSLLCGRANSHHGGFLANVAYMYDRKRWNVVAGNEYHSYEMWTENDREIKTHYYNVCLPYLFVRYRHNGLRWNFQYKTTQKYPTVMQLLEAVNNSNAIMSIKGNNRLEASYHHVLSSRLILSNRDAGSHFVFFSNVEFADNYIGSRRSLSSSSFVDDGNHRNGEMYSYINTNGYWSAKGLLAYGFPIRPIKSNVNVSTMLEHANIPGFWDKDKLYNKQWDWNSFLTIGSNISESIDFVVDTNVKYCQRTNMTYEKKNISYWSLSYGMQLKWLITRSIPFVAECGRTNYFGSGTSQFDAIIGNVSLGYKFLKQKNAEVLLTCHDIFNQDNSFLQTTTELYRRSMTTNLLKRHFLLRFTYSFNTL